MAGEMKEIMDRPVDSTEDLFRGLADFFSIAKSGEQSWLDPFIDAHATKKNESPEDGGK